jgi:hypothetical protein
MEGETQIIETQQGIDIIEAQQRAEYDIQIATAKKYPRRPLKKIKDDCADIITIDDTGDIAATCSYTLSRAGKSISGPSVHLAKMIAQQFGNIRVDAKIKQILYKEKQIVAEAVCFDLETNYASKVEVRKPIQDKLGHIYSNDMIAVTGNAANSIAFRNAVFNVIPRGLTDSLLKIARDKVTADIKNEEELIEKRKMIIDSFMKFYKVTEQMLLRYIGLKEIDDITKEHIPDLRAMFQTLKDGDSTVDEMFNPGKRGSAGPTEADKVAKTFTKPKTNNAPADNNNQSANVAGDDKEIKDNKSDEGKPQSPQKNNEGQPGGKLLFK